MNLKTVFYNRNFSARVTAPKFTVDRYNAIAVGGCDTATLTAEGDERALWEVTSMLRCPVEIYDEQARCLWWGYIHEVTVHLGALNVGVSLDNMNNKVKVAYSYVDPGYNDVGTRKTTAWYSDTTSQGEFGIKELIASLSGATDAQAQQLAQVIINQYADPTPQYEIVEKQALSATVYCRGWWSTLNWRYAYWSPESSIRNLTSGGDAPIGDVTARTRLGQSFTVGSVAVRALTITTKFKKAGSPTDIVKFGLQADTSGTPSGTYLGTAGLAGTSITTSYVSYVGTLNTQVTLSANTLYWFVQERTGTINGSNFVSLPYGTTSSYAGGSTMTYNGTSWSAGGAGNDEYFSINVDSAIVTTNQIDKLVADYGQFITRVTIADASGISTSSYRDGDTTLLAEVEELLKTGTTNNRRLLASVDKDRQMRVFEEPTTTSYYYKKTGQVTDAGGGILPRGFLPVAAWVELMDAIPITNQELIINPAKFFIEEAEWDNQADRLRLRPRGQKSVWEIFR